MTSIITEKREELNSNYLSKIMLCMEDAEYIESKRRYLQCKGRQLKLQEIGGIHLLIKYGNTSDSIENDSSVAF